MTLPAPDQLPSYAAILTWFGDPIEAPRPYLRWAASVARSGVKFIVLGETGGRFWTNELPLINELLKQIGIQHAGRYVDITFDTVFTKELPKFEATPDPVRPPYPVITRARPDLQTLEELSVPAREGGGRSVVAAVSSHGGFVASGFEMMVEPRLGRARWLIDPYAFFRSVLDARESPRPDVTTLSGRRVFLALIDIGESDEIRRGGDGSPPAALLHELVMRHSAIPMTLSFDPQDFSSDSGSAAPRRGLLEELLRLPQIEGAVRTEFCQPNKTLFTAKKACLSLSAPGQDGSVLQSLHMADKGARIGLIQLLSSEAWSDAAARAAQRMRLRPIQEVFSRYSASYPSVAYVAPLALGGLASPIVLLPGDARSARTAQSMEDFIEMATTSEKTERPRRLAPLFWHFQLKILADPDVKDLIERKLQQFESADLHMISIREYVDMVNDFANCEVEQLGPKLWRVSKLGAVHTFRFDNAEGLVLDLARSEGVLGARREGISLYISIDAAKDEARIALGDTASPAPSLAGLHDSGWSVSNLQRGQCGWTYLAAGFGRGEFTWYDIPAGRYDVSATGEHRESWRASAQTNALHHLHFSAPWTSSMPVQFTVRCESNVSSVPQ